MSTMLSVFTIHYAIDAVERARRLAPRVQAHAIAQIHRSGVNFAPLRGTSRHDASILEHALGGAIASAARPPLIFATTVVTLGFLISFLIPRVGPHRDGSADEERDDDAAHEAEMFATAVAG
jgi:hypothetical protein